MSILRFNRAFEGSPKDLLADCRGGKILRLGKGGINTHLYFTTKQKTFGFV